MVRREVRVLPGLPNKKRRKVKKTFLIIIFLCIYSSASSENFSSNLEDYGGFRAPLDKECTLVVGRDIHIRVIEKRPQWRSWDYELWEGDVKRYDRIKIKCNSGKLIYSYSPVGDNKSYGYNRANCNNGKIVRVP